MALYGKPGGWAPAWAMTERRRAALHRDITTLNIGPSRIAWHDGSLVIQIDEVCAPLPRRIRGTVRVHPAALTGAEFELDGGGHHRWSPIAPVSRVEVSLDRPSMQWSGPGYLDSNRGDRPLEADFAHWDWCRAPTEGGAAILYNAVRLKGGERSLALRVDRDGTVSPFAAPQRVLLQPTRWQIQRRTRADFGSTPRVRQTLTDAPFYARSVIETRLLGQDVVAVHESLDMARFTSPVVQAMLPFRVPRH